MVWAETGFSKFWWILRVNFFSKRCRIFSTHLTAMLRVSVMCVYSCSLRRRKNWSHTTHTSKDIMENVKNCPPPKTFLIQDCRSIFYTSQWVRLKSLLDPLKRIWWLQTLQPDSCWRMGWKSVSSKKMNVKFRVSYRKKFKSYRSFDAIFL